MRISPPDNHKREGTPSARVAAGGSQKDPDNLRGADGRRLNDACRGQDPAREEYEQQTDEKHRISGRARDQIVANHFELGDGSTGGPVPIGGRAHDDPSRDVPRHYRWRVLTRLADNLPGREALDYSDAGERWTFRALDDEARPIARGLVASAWAPATAWPCGRPTCPEWIVLEFALAKIGAILVTVNTALRAQEVAYLLKQSDTSTLVTIAGFRRGLSRRAPCRRRDRRRRLPLPRLSEAGAHDLHWRRRPVGSQPTPRCAKSRRRCRRRTYERSRQRSTSTP